MIRSLRVPRNVWVLLAAIFLIAAGEELWSKFAPRFLEALGAGVLAVAAYGVLKDFLDAVYPFLGGTATALLGSKRSLVVFNVLAVLGYGAFAAARTWWILLLALPLVMAWQSFSLPATFSVVGNALPSGRRSVAIAMQSLVRRVPVALGPIVGGLIIAAYGLVAGVRLALVIGIAFGLAAIVMQTLLYRPEDAAPLSLRDALRDVAGLHRRLKLLLIADVLVRFGQGIGEIFIVLYAIDVVGVTPTAYGLLVGLAMAVSIVVYLPFARLADATAKEPWVLVTFAFFALFPLALALTSSATLLPLAFVCMGLREIGEPARKALIVDLSRPKRASVDVGAYYLVRGLAVFGASLVGGILWKISPHLTFFAAGAVAAFGALVFSLTHARR